MTIFGMVTTEKSTKYTSYALESFFKHTTLEPRDIFYLIDNDQSYQIPQILTKYPIEIITNSEPLSFAGNANQIARIALDNNTNLVFLNNDVIFSKNWYPKLVSQEPVVTVAMSNNEIQYTIPLSETENYTLPMKCELEHYLHNPNYFEKIVDAHEERCQNLPQFFKLLVAPFFVVNIPYPVLKEVGNFDLSYGIGGGEDFDYCIRTYLAGFSVSVSQSAFLLHFGGKSISTDNTSEPGFIKVFRKKWGSKLAQLVFGDTRKILEQSQFQSVDFQKLGYKDLIQSLLKT